MLRHYVFVMFVVASLFVATCSSFACNKVTVRQGDDLVNVLAEKNKRFIIQEDIDLGGKKVNLGEGSLLEFKGGSFSNGTVVGNHTVVKADNYEIFKRGSTRYRAYVKEGSSPKMPPTLIKEYHNCIILEGIWDNTICGTHWTGLLKDSNEDVMLAVKNYVTMHREGVTVKFPTFNALGYENTRLPGGYVIDFNNSTISYPDNLDIWVDKSISLPAGATACPMETGYGFIFVKSNTTIANLNLDGKSLFRQNEPLKLGVSCLVCIDNASNVLIENVTLRNALGPAIVSHSKSKDITFKDCHFYNVGEHVIYSHQYLGYCHFERCLFDTWDSERLSVYRNGLDYLFKHSPLSGGADASYEELYNFDLNFTDCIFNNPKRVDANGRTLGGFLTGDFPVVVKLNNCKFTGAMPIFNPGGKEITEKTGKAYKMIARFCDGAPNPYASKANYNIIAEYYDCINIPFRVVYAKCYERCKLFFDLYEDPYENITSAFKNEFSEPLVIKDCEFIDRGSNIKINHPIYHRPLLLENCRINSTTVRRTISDFITIKAEVLSSIEFKSCDIDLPGFRLVGGKDKIRSFDLNHCIIKTFKEQ